MQGGQLGSILDYAASATGLDKEKQRKKLISKIEEAQALLWSIEGARDVWFTRRGCLEVECFCEPCSNCANKWLGVVIPAEVAQVDALTWENRIIKLDRRHGSGRSRPQGYSSSCCGDGGAGRIASSSSMVSDGSFYSDCGCFAAEDMGENYWLERGIDCECTGPVTFFADLGEDTGKLVGVDYTDEHHNRQREDIRLATEGVGTGWGVGDFHSISFPERCGYIYVHDARGREVGRYHPAVTEPRHRRYRIRGLEAGTRIEWEGVVEPQKLRFDTDWVSTTNPIVWKSALQILGLQYKEGQTQSENTAYVRLINVLAGVIAQEQETRAFKGHSNLAPREGISAIKNRSNRIARVANAGVGRRRWRSASW
jgi:hypothetical protein